MARQLHPFAICSVCACVLFAPLSQQPARGEDAPAKITYADHIQPIFRQHCFACHGPDQQKNDLALNSFTSAIKGGASGEVVAAGDPDGSYLWQLVNHDAEPAMPPNGAAKLPQPELDLIRAWIAGGLLERGDSEARKPKHAAVAAFSPTADNRPAGEPAMPSGLLREPVLPALRRGAATAVAVSPWAPLAAVAADYQVSLYHADSGELLGVLPFVEGTPYVVRFSRDGSVLLAAGGRASAQGLAALFDVNSGQRLATVGDELDAVMAADLSPDHALVAVGGPRKIVRVYRAADGALAYEITKHTDWITALEFSPDGKFLATADRSGGLWLWDAATGRERGELRGHAEQITALSWRDDGAVLASASEDDTVRLWQPDGVQIKSWAAHGAGVLCVQFSHQGQLVTAGRDQRIKTWGGDGAAVRDVAGMDDATLAARFTPDGVRIVASDWAGNVRAFEASTGSTLGTFDPNPPTITARLAALEVQVVQERTAAQTSRDEFAAAEKQLVAAESALDEARAQVEQLRQRQADREAALKIAEEHLAAVAAQQAAVERAGAELAAELTSTQEELAVAAAEESAIRNQRDEAAAAEAKQEKMVDDFVGQMAKIEETLRTARQLLTSLTQGLDAQNQAVTAAEARIGDLQAKQAAVIKRQAELKAIKELRAKYADQP
jgi:mono/diheme cytochrome c family protein